jgi:light-regulated signal transduction histidine kinase (bacteriophytochrome)
MNSIINDLLNFAKEGKDKLKLVEVDTTALVNEVWTNLGISAPHHAILQLQPLPVVQADASMLQQVVVNLLSNAIKYSSKKDKPVVEVGYTETEHKIIFHVKDNGAGFSMKNYDRLFLAFQRLHGVTDFEGTGIGLTLVKRIIQRHGGEVWAEAIENEGATFYFSLPKVGAACLASGTLSECSN